MLSNLLKYGVKVGVREVAEAGTRIAAEAGRELAHPLAITLDKGVKAFGKQSTTLFANNLARGIKPIANDFVQTDSRIANWMINWASEGGRRNLGKVLEPSAGEGDLLKEIYKRTGTMPSAIEMDPGRVNYLRSIGIPDVKEGDFLTRVAMPEDRANTIIMNPPFSKGQAKFHMLNAYENYLEPGGKLVSVIPDRELIKGTPLRKWVDANDNVELIKQHTHIRAGNRSTNLRSRERRTAISLVGMTKPQ